MRVEINDLSVLLSMVADCPSLVTVLSDAAVPHIPQLKAVTIDHPGCGMDGCVHLPKGAYCKNSVSAFLAMLTSNSPILQTEKD